VQIFQQAVGADLQIAVLPQLSDVEHTLSHLHCRLVHFGRIVVVAAPVGVFCGVCTGVENSDENSRRREKVSAEVGLPSTEVQLLAGIDQRYRWRCRLKLCASTIPQLRKRRGIGRHLGAPTGTYGLAKESQLHGYLGARFGIEGATARLAQAGDVQHLHHHSPAMMHGHGILNLNQAAAISGLAIRTDGSVPIRWPVCGYLSSSLSSERYFHVPLIGSCTASVLAAHRERQSPCEGSPRQVCRWHLSTGQQREILTKGERTAAYRWEQCCFWMTTVMMRIG
jgi:hypothetical protein